jgi:hypothetical protein
MENDPTKNRLALYRKPDGSYIIEPEEWPGSRKKAGSLARKRGLVRCFGSQDRATLEKIKARLESASK